MFMIKYPNGIKKQTSDASPVLTRYGGRGASLEDDLNRSNEYYRECDIALIYKKPTPIQVVRVDYPNRAHAKIIEAYYRTPSTTDYNGIYQGKAIDFEAKETINKTMFPFKYIHAHQIEHLRKVIKHGGIAFLIIRFSAHAQTYLVPAEEILSRYDAKQKSISYRDVCSCGQLIREGFTPRLHYLDAVDAIYFKEEIHHDEKVK